MRSVNFLTRLIHKNPGFLRYSGVIMKQSSQVFNSKMADYFHSLPSPQVSITNTLLSRKPSGEFDYFVTFFRHSRYTR